MPTVLREGPYRFYFWSHEDQEPPHVYVDRDAFSAKFWLEPTELSRNRGFRPHELRLIQSIIDKHQDLILEAWHEHFGERSG